jgi:hypothetical protein
VARKTEKYLEWALRYFIEKKSMISPLGVGGIVLENIEKSRQRTT